MPATYTDRLDGLTTSVAVKAPCRVATTEALTLSGLQTVDGVTVAADDRVLVKNQADASENGIYVAQSNLWTRALDFDGSRDAVGGTHVSVLEGDTNTDTFWRPTGTGTKVIGEDDLNFEAALLTDSSSARFLQVGSGAVARSAQDKLREHVSVKDFGALGDGTTDDSAAWQAAVDAIPAWGGTIYVPDAVGYRVDTKIACDKRVRWIVGASTISCPPDDFLWEFQINGWKLECAGRNATIFKFRTDGDGPIPPTFTVALDGGGGVTTVVPSGGSNLKSNPVLLASNTTLTDPVASDAGVIAAVAGDTISDVVIVPGVYAVAPTITMRGGGAGVFVNRGAQDGCAGDFSIDYQSIPYRCAFFHDGGWYYDYHRVNRVYNLATGDTSEHPTCLGPVVSSSTLGVPGPDGSYNGAYGGELRKLTFDSIFLVGHDSSKLTTTEISGCDIKERYYHNAFSLTEKATTAQALAGQTNWHLVNVDGLFIESGDNENAGLRFHFIGACPNMDVDGLNTVAHSGTAYRGESGGGSQFRYANVTSFDLTELVCSLNGGWAIRNAGYVLNHPIGVTYDGARLQIGTNLRLTATGTGTLTDDNSNGVAIELVSNSMRVVTREGGGGASGAITQIVYINPLGVEVLDGAGFRVDGKQVVGARLPAIAPATGGAVIDNECRFEVEQLRSAIVGHGLIEA